MILVCCLCWNQRLISIINEFVKLMAQKEREEILDKLKIKESLLTSVLSRAQEMVDEYSKTVQYIDQIKISESIILG